MPQIAAQREQHLIERIARALAVTLRPKQRTQSLTRHSTRSGDRKNSKQCKWTTPHGRRPELVVSVRLKP